MSQKNELRSPSSPAESATVVPSPGSSAAFSFCNSGTPLQLTPGGFTPSSANATPSKLTSPPAESPDGHQNYALVGGGDKTPSSETIPSGSPNPEASSSQLSKEDQQPLPLAERVPSTEDVLAVLRSEHDTKMIFQHSRHFKGEEGVNALLNVDLWDSVSEKIRQSIEECAASTEKDINRMSEKHDDDISNIIDRVIPNIYRSRDGDTEERIREARGCIQALGFNYVEIYRNLIQHLFRGEQRTSIRNQVNMVIACLLTCKTDDFFDDPIVAEHSYYITGFLGNQLANESQRRGKNTEVRRCMEALSVHFVVPTDEEKMEKIRSNLPTSLVDTRLAFNGLHYPDELCFRIFACVEVTFSLTATPENVVFRGGQLTREICDAMLENPHLFALVSSLFDEHAEFSAQAVATTFAYMMRVFGHVRTKDLARRFNVAIYNGSTVALRPTLAALSQKGKKKNKKIKCNKKPMAKRTATNKDKDDHNIILECLSDLENNCVEDSNSSKKISSREIIENM